MLTKEFKNQINNLGFTVSWNDFYYKGMTRSGETLFNISTEDEGCIDTDWDSFVDLDSSTRLALLNIVIEYSCTPIKEREPVEDEK